MANKPTISKPISEATISVMIDKNEREIFMSFGLLDSLSRIIEDPTRIPSISIDPDLRNKVLIATLAERKPSGKILQNIDLEDTEISIDDVERLIDWAGDHVMSFFIRSLQKTVAVTKAREEEMKALASSFGGLKDSISKTP